MPDLLELQNQFYNHIINKETKLDFIKSNFPQERLNIYRQTIFANMIGALKINFPGIWRLVGDECAENIAYAYCKTLKYFPETGCLDDFGNDFPEFIASLPQLSSLPYLSDYARYELLKFCSYGAKNDDFLDVHAISNLNEHSCLQLVSSCVFFQSEFPIDQILEMLENPDSDGINLTRKPCFAIITRLENYVTTFWVSSELWHFIYYLKQGYNIEESYNKTLDLSLEEAISFLFSKQIVQNIIENK